MKRWFTVRGLALSALIAALYVVISYLSAPLTSGQVQFRLAEALGLLPVLTPMAIPGVVVGCLITNILFGQGILDWVFGTLATVIAVFLTYGLRKKPLWVAALPPVLVNMVVIAVVLNIVLGLPLLINMAWIGLGQAVVCFGLGIPLILALRTRLK